MDETGFNIGDFEARHVMVNTTVQSRYQAQPGWQEWVTAVECICADGSVIVPFIILKGQHVSNSWINSDTSWD